MTVRVLSHTGDAYATCVRYTVDLEHSCSQTSSSQGYHQYYEAAKTLHVQVSGRLPVVSSGPWGAVGSVSWDLHPPRHRALRGSRASPRAADLCLGPQGRDEPECVVTVPNEFLQRIPPPGEEDLKALEQIAESSITPKCAAAVTSGRKPG